MYARPHVTKAYILWPSNIGIDLNDLTTRVVKKCLNKIYKHALLTLDHDYVSLERVIGQRFLFYLVFCRD